MLTSKKMIDEKSDDSVGGGEEFTDLEEIIFRSHYGVHVDKEAPLQKKTRNKDLLARLLKIERDAIRRAREKGIIGVVRKKAPNEP